MMTTTDPTTTTDVRALRADIQRLRAQQSQIDGAIRAAKAAFEEEIAPQKAQRDQLALREQDLLDHLRTLVLARHAAGGPKTADGVQLRAIAQLQILDPAVALTALDAVLVGGKPAIRRTIDPSITTRYLQLQQELGATVPGLALDTEWVIALVGAANDE